MTVLSLLAVNASEVELLRPVVIGWLIIAFALSAIEIFWLTSSSRKGSRVTASSSDHLKAVDRWENEGGRISPFKLTEGG